MTQSTPALPKPAKHYPVHPAIVVVGILMIAGTAKLGHGAWGISGLLAFYPVYFAMLAGHRTAVAAFSQVSPALLNPRHPSARVSGPR